jgi:hypothetical protein
MATAKAGSPAAQPESKIQTVQRVPMTPVVATIGGFTFDQSNFPHTLLEILTNIAEELRKLGLDKTGGKASSDPKKKADAKYGYFEEAEIAAHLVILLNKHSIGYASGTTAITGRYEAGKTQSGGTMWTHHVTSSVVFSHKESREWIIVPGVGEAFDSGDKGVTKAITSAIKYIWMKTFLISDGQANDIETDQTTQTVGETTKRSTRGATRPAGGEDRPAVTKAPPQCGFCQAVIGDATKDGKVVKTRAEIIKSTVEKLGKQACIKCAIKLIDRDSTPATKPPAKRGEKKAEPEPRERIEKPLKAVEWKSFTVKKGKDAGTEKQFANLTLDGLTGKIADFHESHFDLYEGGKVGDMIQCLVDTKQNGKYVDRTMYALLSYAGEEIEDEKGNKLAPPDYSPESEQDVVERGADASPFGGSYGDIVDDDIPF